MYVLGGRYQWSLYDETSDKLLYQLASPLVSPCKHVPLKWTPVPRLKQWAPLPRRAPWQEEVMSSPSRALSHGSSVRPCCSPPSSPFLNAEA
jgi:hypothetical protein